MSGTKTLAKKNSKIKKEGTCKEPEGKEVSSHSSALPLVSNLQQPGSAAVLRTVTNGCLFEAEF